MSETYSKRYSKYIDYTTPRLGIEGQYIYRFPNGYGASVIPETYGIGVEIAVIYFVQVGENEVFELISDTHITNDVVRHETDLDHRLKQIKELE